MDEIVIRKDQKPIQVDNVDGSKKPEANGANFNL